MRRFTDDEGRPWEAVVGRASWGTLYALFVPVGRGREEPVMQALLAASGYEAAQAELAELAEDELRELLRRSVPRNERS